MTQPKLEYFYFDACPFCQTVNQVIKKLGVQVEYKNIQENKEHLDRLIQDTGRRTVPCLYVDGSAMHESSDIIDWLSSNLERLPKV
jgi:glutaredoxin